MAAFNPLLALAGGVSEGIEAAETAKRAAENKKDEAYQQLTMKTDYDNAQKDAQQRKDAADNTTNYNAIQKVAGLDKQNTLSQATVDAHNASSIQVAAQTGVMPTNTPQGPSDTSTTAQVQGAGQIGAGTTLPVPQGAKSGMLPETPASNPAWVGNTSTPAGSIALQGGTTVADSTNPLLPSTAQNLPPVDNTANPASTNDPNEEFTDSLGHVLTRDQATRATAYGTALNAKLGGGLVLTNSDGSKDGSPAYLMGLQQVIKEDGQLGNGVNKTGMNSQGFMIGKIADGLVAPTLSEKFDPAMNGTMTPAQASIKDRHDEEQLSKDKDAAIQANKAATEFSMYLSGNEAGDSGGLNRIGFIRDIGGALDSKDATLDSINKSLTFNIVGFERTPGMRLTQAEFFIAREAMPGRGNTPQANQNIAQFWQAKLQLPQEYAQFKQDYMVANNGHWNEALGNRMFQQYQSDNPIFDPKILAHPEQAQLSDFKLNPNRQSLEDYAQNGGFSKLKFLGVSPPSPQVVAPAQPSNNTANAATTQQPAPQKDFSKLW